MHRITQIAITNMVVLNGGDGAIMQGTIEILRKAFGEDCRFVVFASDPVASARAYPETEIHETLGLAASRARWEQLRFIGGLSRRLRALRYRFATRLAAHGVMAALLLLPKKDRISARLYMSSDLIVSGGGTYLKDQYGIRSQYLDYEFTLSFGKPLAFFTQSIGPLKIAQNKALIGRSFRGAGIILVRDEPSEKCVRDAAKRNVPIRRFPDAAFALVDKDKIEGGRMQAKETREKMRVVVSVREWQHFASKPNTEGMRAYRQSIAAAVAWLLEAGADVTFMSSCQGIGEYDDDSAEVDRIVNLLEIEYRDAVTIRRDFVRYDDLIEELASFDLCIGTRMHMCILSLCAGTPALPVSYEFKTRELFGRLQLSDRVTDIETIEPVAFVNNLENFLADMPRLADSVFDSVLALRDEAYLAGDAIREALAKK